MKKSVGLLVLFSAVVLSTLPLGLEGRTKKVPAKLREFTGLIARQAMEGRKEP